MITATYLPVRLASQRANLLRWTGTCNVTSLAMALTHTLPETCTVTADGLFALLGVAFANEKLLAGAKKTATVNWVRSGQLRAGELENFRSARGVVRKSEFLSQSPAYITKILPQLGKEEVFEGGNDNGPKGRISFTVTNDDLYRNAWYKLKVRRNKQQPSVEVQDAFLENKATWDGQPDIQNVTLQSEFNRIPLGVMRINTSGESLLEVGRIVCGMAATHGKVWLGMEAEGRPALYLGETRYDLSHGNVSPELVQEVFSYREAGKKYVRWGPSVKPENLIEYLRGLTVSKKVAVISGRFTHGGHIVVACGYAEADGQVTGIVIADPWGKGSYEGIDENGARDYSDKATDALVAYEAEGLKQAFKYVAAEFLPLGGQRTLKRGTVSLSTAGKHQIAVVAPLATQNVTAG